MRHYRRLIAALLQMLAGLFVVLALPAQAAPNHIAARLVADTAPRPNGTVLLAFEMTPEAGWHGYWQNPGDAGLGMSLDWTLPAGAKAGAPRYPVPDTLLIAGLMNHVYEHAYAVLVPFTPPPGATAGARLPVRVKAQWLACTEQICVPEEAELATEVVLGGTNHAAQFDRWQAALPAPLGSPARFAQAGGILRIGIPLPTAVKLERPHLFIADERVVDYAAPQRFLRQGDLLVVEVPRARIEPVAPAALSAVLRLNAAGDGVELSAAPGSIPAGGTPVAAQAPAPAANLAMLLLAALAGGLLLNVMPCVFPILSLKALSLARAGESEAQARAEGLAYTAGVVLACLALGALMLGLRAAGEEVGWAFQLQEPLVVAALLLVAVAITANLLGVYEFAVPGFASEGSPQGAFATGLLAAFAATPCTGPFMAAAMGAALLLPVAPALALFGALGLGLALPFLAIAFVPALRRALPRPGAWMVWFRKAMAVPMGLTALALAWLASRVGGDAFALSAGLLALIAVAVLVVLGRRQRHGLAAGPMVLAALAGIVVIGAAGLPTVVREPGAETAGVLPSTPFSANALDTARASGKPVFAYFTADWCLTCKVNEQVAIEREDTRAAFEQAGVIVLRGDWTRRDPAITRFLSEQGAAGVPLYLWYPAKGGPARQLPQVLTPQLLADLAKP